MNFRFLIKTIKGLIFNTDEEWAAISAENKTDAFLNLNIIFPLVSIVSLSAFAGSIIFSDSGLPVVVPVMNGIRYFVLFYISIYGTSFIFKYIAEKLGQKNDFTSSFKIVTGSIVPFMLCMIISLLFESFIFVNILAFYGLYISWAGIKKLINPPPDKNMILMLAEAAAFLIIFFTGDRILTLITDMIYYSIYIK